MRRTLIAAACILLLPALAQAAAFTASLSGDSGSGFATISVAGDDIDYNILVSGIAATAAELSNGTDTIDLQASFTNGTAIGSVSSSMASDVAADPTAWNLSVTDGSSTLTGALSAGAGSEPVMLYLPVVATVSGQAGTNYLTDARFVNTSGSTATVEFSYWPQGSGNAAPGATATETIAAGAELVLNDMATELFGVTNGKGGVSISSDATIFGSARIYNDQTAAGAGTFGQYVPAGCMAAATQVGAVEFLSNESVDSATGYRSNIGWFNPNDADVTVNFTAYDADGTMLSSSTQTAGMQALMQKRADQLFPTLAEYGDFYVTFSASAPIFVYGSVVDNINGDAVYVSATATN